MKIKSAVFSVSAPNLDSCPESARPEFAMIGRSNVGKSSLINALTEKRDLANVSVTPGKTQLINFFLINSTWHLVDLPGYGYAEVSKTKRAGFNEAVANYLEHRENIFCVFVLIDSRLTPQTIDLEFVRWLEGCRVPFVLVFTKADKLASSRVEETVKLFKQAMLAWTSNYPRIFITSAKSKTGRTEILNFIEQSLADPVRQDESGSPGRAGSPIDEGD